MSKPPKEQRTVRAHVKPNRYRKLLNFLSHSPAPEGLDRQRAAATVKEAVFKLAGQDYLTNDIRAVASNLGYDPEVINKLSMGDPLAYQRLMPALMASAQAGDTEAFENSLAAAQARNEALRAYIERGGAPVEQSGLSSTLENAWRGGGGLIRPGSETAGREDVANDLIKRLTDQGIPYNVAVAQANRALGNPDEFNRAVASNAYENGGYDSGLLGLTQFAGGGFSPIAGFGAAAGVATGPAFRGFLNDVGLSHNPEASRYRDDMYEAALQRQLATGGTGIGNALTALPRAGLYAASNAIGLGWLGQKATGDSQQITADLGLAGSTLATGGQNLNDAQAENRRKVEQLRARQWAARYGDKTRDEFGDLDLNKVQARNVARSIGPIGGQRSTELASATQDRYFRPGELEFGGRSGLDYAKGQAGGEWTQLASPITGVLGGAASAAGTVLNPFAWARGEVGEGVSDAAKGTWKALGQPAEYVKAKARNFRDWAGDRDTSHSRLMEMAAANPNDERVQAYAAQHRRAASGQGNMLSDDIANMNFASAGKRKETLWRIPTWMGGSEREGQVDGVDYQNYVRSADNDLMRTYADSGMLDQESLERYNLADTRLKDQADLDWNKARRDNWQKNRSAGLLATSAMTKDHSAVWGIPKAAPKAEAKAAPVAPAAPVASSRPAYKQPDNAPGSDKPNPLSTPKFSADKMAAQDPPWAAASIQHPKSQLNLSGLGRRGEWQARHNLKFKPQVDPLQQVGNVEGRWRNRLDWRHMVRPLMTSSDAKAFDPVVNRTRQEIQRGAWTPGTKVDDLIDDNGFGWANPLGAVGRWLGTAGPSAAGQRKQLIQGMKSSPQYQALLQSYTQGLLTPEEFSQRLGGVNPHELFSGDLAAQRANTQTANANRWALRSRDVNSRAIDFSKDYLRSAPLGGNMTT